MDKFETMSLNTIFLWWQGIPWPDWLNWTLLIDGFGLALAIIGFFNLANPIEAYFKRIHDEAEAANDLLGQTLSKILPLHKNGWRLFVEGFRIILWPVLPAAIVALPISGQLSSFWLWLTTTDWRILLVIILITPILFFIYVVFVRLLVNRTLKLIYWGIWRIISILAYPPSGILGTIGLTITAASIVMNRVT